MIHTSRMLTYWTPRKDSCREAEEQHEYYTNLMKFLVTKLDTERHWPKPQGPSLVFPSL